MSTEDRLQALRGLSTILKEKGEVPEGLWEKAGVSVGARLKDVEKEIVALKKNVSKSIKTEIKTKQMSIIEEEAVKQGITVEELLKKERNVRDYNEQLKQNRDRVRDRDRAKKELQRKTDLGEHDMAVDYV